jgi:hypothetical protein
MDILLADMERDIRNGLTYDGKLPFGFKTVAEVKESRIKLQAIIKQHPEIAKSLKKRSDAINKIKRDAGLLPPSSHQILGKEIRNGNRLQGCSYSLETMDDGKEGLSV